MNQQVITIAPDGTMSGLQRKPGQGIDLRKFGKADIKRASLIEWDEAEQAWFIDVLQKHGKGRLTWDAWCIANPGVTVTDLCPSGASVRNRGNDHTILFVEYDEAVKVEIAYLDALRLKGQF